MVIFLLFERLGIKVWLINEVNWKWGLLEYVLGLVWSVVLVLWCCV